MVQLSQMMKRWENGAIITDDENDSKIIQGHVHLGTLIFKSVLKLKSFSVSKSPSIYRNLTMLNFSTKEQFWFSMTGFILLFCAGAEGF